MVVITPGIDFLVKGAVFFSIPILTVFGAGIIYGHITGIAPPNWLLTLSAFASIPIIMIFQITTTRRRHAREAAAMGAKMVPCVEGRWPGSADILLFRRHYFLNGYPGDDLHKVQAICGPVANLRVFWSDMIFTASPEHIKLILATDFENYVKGERSRADMGDVLGVGVFNSDGDMWKFHRSITRPAFVRSRLEDFGLLNRHAEAVIKHLRTRLNEGYPVDFQDLMSRFTLDSASEFLFGNCVNSLGASTPYPHHACQPSVAQTPEAHHAQQFSVAFLAAQDVIAQRTRLGTVWPLFELLTDKTKEHMKIVNSYIEPIIAEAIRRKDSNPTREKGELSELREDETLLDHLVRVAPDPKILKDETLNVMIAGRDTMAATLTFVIYFLSQHPIVMDRLRQEILNQVGPTRSPTLDDVRQMKYLRAVLNETLRLYPPIPINIRESVHTTTWPNPDPNGEPFYIPAGTKTIYSVFVMHRRKDLWGPDAEEFDPDRFLDERANRYLAKNPFIFLPFNAGPRICLGQQFAYNEISVMLIWLCQNFSSISLEPQSFPSGTLPPPKFKSYPGRKGIEKVWPKLALTLYIAGGLWVTMQEASQSQDNVFD